MGRSPRGPSPPLIAGDAARVVIAHGITRRPPRPGDSSIYGLPHQLFGMQVNPPLSQKLLPVYFFREILFGTDLRIV